MTEQGSEHGRKVEIGDLEAEDVRGGADRSHMLRLQQDMQKTNQLFNMLSQMMKLDHDTKMAAIRKMA